MLPGWMVLGCADPKLQRPYHLRNFFLISISVILLWKYIIVRPHSNLSSMSMELWRLPISKLRPPNLQQAVRKIEDRQYLRYKR